MPSENELWGFLRGEVKSELPSALSVGIRITLEDIPFCHFVLFLKGTALVNLSYPILSKLHVFSKICVSSNLDFAKTTGNFFEKPAPTANDDTTKILRVVLFSPP